MRRRDALMLVVTAVAGVTIGHTAFAQSDKLRNTTPAERAGLQTEFMKSKHHGEVIAAILRPFISRDNYFLLQHHGLFQTYFYATHLGLDPNARDRFKSDPAYERTVEFCAKYDEVSFDPRYPNEPLATFEPMVRRLLAKGWTPPQ